jgi:putative tryptophan/tyrosine transport system substrate-binding protein
MKRREFISLLGGVAAWPIAARGQQAATLPTIGFLGGATLSAWVHWTAAFAQRLRELGWMAIESAWVHWTAAFAQRLRELGWMAIEYRWGGAANATPRLRPSSSPLAYCFRA